MRLHDWLPQNIHSHWQPQRLSNNGILKNDVISCLDGIMASVPLCVCVCVCVCVCRYLSLRPRVCSAEKKRGAERVLTRKLSWGATRAEDAQGTPTQSHISPSILVYEKKLMRFVGVAGRLRGIPRRRCTRTAHTGRVLLTHCANCHVLLTHCAHCLRHFNPLRALFASF